MLREIRHVFAKIAGGILFSAAAISPAEPLSPPQARVKVLEQSRDGREIKNAAIALAGSRSPQDHAVLQKYLSSEDFLRRLDSPEDYQGVYTDLRLGRVIDTLVENRIPSSDRLLVDLIRSRDFQAHVLRIQILLRALAAVRPAPPPVIAYWDRLSNPESPIQQDVIEALCANQSPAALDLLERKFADPAQKAERKIRWMRLFILVRRNDAPLLAGCERMITKSLPAELRPPLVEVLFDYRPQEWFMLETPPEPPPRSAASAESRRILVRIAKYALAHLKLSPHSLSVLRETLRSLSL
jgi:hypothetical protein